MRPATAATRGSTPGGAARRTASRCRGRSPPFSARPRPRGSAGSRSSRRTWSAGLTWFSAVAVGSGPPGLRLLSLHAPASSCRARGLAKAGRWLRGTPVRRAPRRSERLSAVADGSNWWNWGARPRLWSSCGAARSPTGCSWKRRSLAPADLCHARFCFSECTGRADVGHAKSHIILIILIILITVAPAGAAARPWEGRADTAREAAAERLAAAGA
mmetsp:Transcript_37117/g.100446  ORF Transcript_37117/g.100446 Transcript_37117/m.100446 type:complete len:216 (+) Transcript_37117:350-997(+)